MANSYRIRFDVPYDWSVEPGYQRALHCADFRPQKDSFDGTFQEPSSGLIMLEPKIFNRDYADDFKPLADWRKVDTHWQLGALDGEDEVWMNRVKPASDAETAIAIAALPPVISLNDSATKRDQMVWAKESEFTLGEDEGFALYFMSLGMEFKRKSNWFMLQWDDIGLHFSQRGECRVYRYDRANMSAEPTLYETFEIGYPTEQLHKMAYLVVIPIPTLGLALYTAKGAVRQKGQTSSAFTGLTRMHVISRPIDGAWPTSKIGDGDGFYRLTERSKILIGVNPYEYPIHGFQLIRYPNAGTYTDAAYDPGYMPSELPSLVLPTPIRTAAFDNATAFLERVDDPDLPWTVAHGDPQARVRMNLSSAVDNILTPFIQGYGVVFDPVFTERDTTPSEPDVLFGVEWTEDEYGRMEGECEIEMRSAANRLIWERNDATFVLERSADDGETWETVFGGLAKEFTGKLLFDPFANESYYRGTVKLLDLWERFREIHKPFETAADGVRLGSACNVIIGSAFQKIADADLPARLQEIVIPQSSDGHAWRHAPRQSDNGEEALFRLLFAARRQYEEWRAVYDWDSAQWALEQKPRDLTTVWRLTPYDTDRDEENRVWYYQPGPEPRPKPPEGNTFATIGLTNTETSAAKIMGRPLVNLAALNDKASPDYSGRYQFVYIQVPEQATPEQCALTRRRVFDSAAHRRFQTENVHIADYVDGLRPNVQVDFEREDEDVIARQWIKRRTVVVVGGGPPDGPGFMEGMILALDDRWEGEISLQ